MRRKSVLTSFFTFSPFCGEELFDSFLRVIAVMMRIGDNLSVESKSLADTFAHWIHPWNGNRFFILVKSGWFFFSGCVDASWRLPRWKVYDSWAQFDYILCLFCHSRCATSQTGQWSVVHGHPDSRHKRDESLWFLASFYRPREILFPVSPILLANHRRRFMARLVFPLKVATYTGAQYATPVQELQLLTLRVFSRDADVKTRRRRKISVFRVFAADPIWYFQGCAGKGFFSLSI